MRLPLPDPPLTDPESGLLLRPWRPEDAPELAAAWDDPEIRRWCLVPDDAGPARAQRWIAGWAERLDRGLALDLVVERCGVVAGEAGLVPVGERLVELGWWVAPAHRGEGVATAAVSLFASWARRALPVDDVIAEVPDGNPASAAVARSAGLGPAGGGRVSASRPG